MDTTPEHSSACLTAEQVCPQCGEQQVCELSCPAKDSESEASHWLNCAPGRQPLPGVQAPPTEDAADEAEGQAGEQAEGQAERTGRPPATPPESVIDIVVTENPKRPGSASFDRFALYRNGMTVAQYLEAGGHRSDLNWDESRDFIRITRPEAA